jgi:dipeptidyl aminopeptidase/acylaminoacyl peptidase
MSGTSGTPQRDAPQPTTVARNGGPDSDSHPFSVHDMLAMKRLSDPQASPDGKWIVFVLTSFDIEKNESTADLWLVGADGSDLRRLTSHPAKDGNPRWAPDGKTIWFVSSRSDASQVWRIPVDGGEAEQVTHEPLDVGNLILSPIGSHVAFSMEVFPDCETPADTKKRLDEIEQRKATGRVYDKLLIRHWDTWKDGRRSHLFVKRVDGGEAVDVMKAMDADVPSKPFGGPEEFTFTPDGKSLVFTVHEPGRDEAWTTTFNLYLVPIDGSATPRPLTTGKACDTHPVFSPDGKTLAYLAMSRPGYESDRSRIVLRSWPTGGRAASGTRQAGSTEQPARDEPARWAGGQLEEPPLALRAGFTHVDIPLPLTEHWDRSAGTILWSPDGRTLYTTAPNVGQRSLFAVDVATGEVRTLVEQGHVTAPIVTGDRIAFGLSHLRSPVELHSVNADGSDWQTLTRINEEKVAAARMGEPDQFSFAGWNDETVYATVLKPVDFDPSKKVPVAFLIHGGPQGSFGNVFHYRWNPQAYAGAGYAVVMVDFHGSTGYGQAFTDSIRDDWGEKPLIDLQKGLAAALERYPWMDGGRVAALGASYGGYMINWIAGNWPDRFRCLVNHDGNLDERMAYYDTEELWFPEWERRGTPWENPEAYTKHNPIDHVHKWQTPMLVIHSANDFRVVDSQGISTFTALQRRGIPSKLLHFPDENHWVLKPANSVLWHETVIGWLDEWTPDERQSRR